MPEVERWALNLGRPGGSPHPLSLKWSGGQGLSLWCLISHWERSTDESSWWHSALQASQKQAPVPSDFFLPKDSSVLLSVLGPSAHRLPLVIPAGSTLNHPPIHSFRVPHILKKKPRLLPLLPGLPLASSALSAPQGS